jgi:hypothetical protein
LKGIVEVEHMSRAVTRELDAMLDAGKIAHVEQLLRDTEAALSKAMNLYERRRLSQEACQLTALREALINRRDREAGHAS